MYTYIHIDTQNQKRENKDLKKIIKVDQTTAVTCLCFLKKSYNFFFSTPLNVLYGWYCGHPNL